MAFATPSDAIDQSPHDMEMPEKFSDNELATLTAICDTLIPTLSVADDPHGLYARKASDLDVPRLMSLGIEQVADPALLFELRLFLRLIEIPIINTIFASGSRPFSRMSLEQRTRLLRSWENSRFNIRRKAFQALKRLALMLFYSVVDEQNHNPNWSAIGYSGVPAISSERPKRTIQPLSVDDDAVFYADVVVVGSGAGGGVVAGELSAAGLDVIILEKGDYYAEPDFNRYELDSTERMFENRGLFTNKDLSMLILAGSTLGGGTTINWAASFRTPKYVLDEWQDQYGLAQFTTDDYQQAMDAVSKRINVSTDYCEANPQNAALETGAKELGLSYGVAPRNVKNCEECGFCNFGCPYGAKQSTLKTYLQDAYNAGSRIIVRTYVDKVLVENGKAVGVQASVTDREGNVHKVIIHAKTVVSSAGSLHTPALLKRSGLGNNHIGNNLHLHPTTVTYGIYNDPIQGWYGPIIRRYVDSFKNQDGQGYGATLETAPIHPGLGALSLSWKSGRQHKQTMSQLSHLGNTIILTRDYFGGRVDINKQGNPFVHYTLNQYDAQHMMRGILESIRIHEAAGAEEIGAPFAMPLTWKRETQDIEDYLINVGNMELLPNNFALYSAHQMSSCRMAATPRLGAVAPNGETFEVKGLYVADGSVLPTASGVNPMLTIMSTAYIIANHIKNAHNF